MAELVKLSNRLQCHRLVFSVTDRLTILDLGYPCGPTLEVSPSIASSSPMALYRRALRHDAAG